MHTLFEESFLKGPVKVVGERRLDDIFSSISSGEHCNETAIIFEDNGIIRKHTFSELNTISTKLAESIHKLIVDKRLPIINRIIAVQMHPSDELIMVLLAIWKMGMAYLPLSHEFPEPMIYYILKDSSPVILIHDGLTLDDVCVPTGLFEELRTSIDNQVLGSVDIKKVQNDTAIIMYTSGSTGQPKGVQLSHKSIHNRLQWQYDTFPYTETEKSCIFKTALTFGDSIAEIWAPLLHGVSLLIVPQIITKNPENFVKLLDTFKIQRIVVVPSFLEIILNYVISQKTQLLENLMLWVTSGEVLDLQLAKIFFKYFKRGTRLCNFYGSTEVTADVTYYIIEGMEQILTFQKIPLGIPIDNTNIYLLNDKLLPVQSNEIGEIFVSGYSTTSYINYNEFLRNTFTIETAHTKLFRTGDRGKIENGDLFFEGRTDSQIKIRGRKINMTEIENTVKSIEGVKKVVVMCYRPGHLNQTLVAFVTTTVPIEGIKIESKLKELLVWYMVPQVIVLQELPYLTSGKLDNQELLNTFHSIVSKGAKINYDGVEKTKFKAARTLFKTIANVLNIRARSEISLKSNFYEIGGDSLNSISTITILNDNGYKISMEDFTSAKNLEEVLNRMLTENKINKINEYVIEPLKQKHRQDIYEILYYSIFHKSDLEQFYVEHISESDYRELLDQLWDPLLNANLSFVVKSESNKIVGAVLNKDVRSESHFDITFRMKDKFELLDAIETPFKNSLLSPELGQTLHVLLISTHRSVPPDENVRLMSFMEEEVINFARQKNFRGIFGTNVNKLTQQLSDYFEYEKLLDYQVNKFVTHDGRFPFADAPDDQRAVVVYRRL